jgi:hypothetical protein
MLAQPLEVSMRRCAVACSLLSLAVGFLAGCPDRSIDKVIPAQGRVEAKDIPVNINRDLDLLFLIDDSPSMKDKQNNLAANFDNFITVLSSIPGGLPNVHIGVVTSDMGTKGGDGAVGTAIPPIGNGGCSGVGKNGDLQRFTAPIGTDLFIADIANPTTGARMRNYPDTMQLKDVFSTMARGAGATGCGFEQHLAAVKQALQPNNPVNVGFLRPDAYLGVIIIADEDDCSLSSPQLLTSDTGTLGPRQSFRCTRFGVSCDVNGKTTDAMNQVGTKNQCHPSTDKTYLTDVADYVSFLKGLKSDPRKVIVAGIMGTLDKFEVEMRPPNKGETPIPALAHSCTYIGADIDGDGKPDPEVADPPVRLQFFLDQFPNRSTFATICQQDLSGGLRQIGDLLKTVIGDPCIEGNLADVDPVTPGAQYDCSVSYVVNPTMANAQETIMGACGATIGSDPCWHLVPDPTNCGTTPTKLTLKIENEDRLKAMGADVHVLANCVTESAQTN